MSESSPPTPSKSSATGTPPCMHGAPVHLPIQRIHEFEVFFLKYAKAFRADNKVDMMFLLENNFSLLDDDYVCLMWARGAATLLAGHMDAAEVYVKQAIAFQIFGRPQSDVQPLENFITEVLSTERGMTKLVDKRIPCNCLAGRVRQASKMAECRCCNVQKKFKNFSTCSLCKLVSYCSKECQTNDWKNGHREECREVRRTCDEQPQHLLHR